MAFRLGAHRSFSKLTERRFKTGVIAAAMQCAACY